MIVLINELLLTLISVNYNAKSPSLNNLTLFKSFNSLTKATLDLFTGITNKLSILIINLP